MPDKPLTASDLADALGCFNNAAIGAMHNGTHTVGCISQGIDAVMWRLREIAEDPSPEPPPAVDAEKMRRALMAIEDLCDGEIKARFASDSKTEQEVAGNSRIYTLLSLPRDIARNALKNDVAKHCS